MLTPEEAEAATVARIATLRDHYHERAKWHRRLFRLTGVVIMALSATLPFLAGLEFEHKDFVVGLIGVVIAVLVAVAGFYRWDELWALLRRTDFDLTHLLDAWELKASVAKDAKERHRLVTRLSEAAEEVRERETMSYFALLSRPGQKPPAPGDDAKDPGVAQ